MIADPLLQAYPNLSEAQRKIIGHINGPLLVIAGPGSGKTFSLVLRAINLLLLNKVQPRELVLCTFTEKAAFELRDRISAAATKVKYTGDLSELRASTIHSLCNRLLSAHRHRTPLGNNYETLDELTELLFIFEHFKEIVGEPVADGFLGKYKTKWTAIEAARGYFNKITEELVNPTRLEDCDIEVLRHIGRAYRAFEQKLYETNHIDFAHLQKLLFSLLQEPDIAESIKSDIKYLMVDEYQDTNYIQEQILFKLTEDTRNLCVVGDEDQSLYRFRGATVRNLLEFTTNVPDAHVVKLTTNYRSHKSIVKAYDRWMGSVDWSNPNGPPFRFDKKIEPDLTTVHPDFPSIFAIWGSDERDEAKRFADLVTFLKTNDVVKDYNQIALLLRSVKREYSGAYLDALNAKGIPAFCPRARAYFDNEEIRLMVGCFGIIFGYHGEGRGQVAGSVQDLANYVDECFKDLARSYSPPHPLSKLLTNLYLDIVNLKEGDSTDLRPADYFYLLIAREPFAAFLKDENRARNLAIFSQLLNVFQNYYHYSLVNFKNRQFIRFHLFNSFLRLLHDGGINEYEDPDQPFPKGYVQVMTIHQAKGLEFPVVAVGSLDLLTSSPKQIDRYLHPFYHRPQFEPESRITEFDRMRLHYVAFSRPEKILVLTTSAQPKPHFNPIWQGLDQWPYVQQALLSAQSFEMKDRMPVKRAFSFTGDLKLYETCPRQYQFFREYDFSPSRSAVIFFGLLVHQTIEEIHRIALDRKLDTLNEPRIREIFDRTYSFLLLSDVRPIGKDAKQEAYRQILNYFFQNQEAMHRVIATEVDVSVEKDDYILRGKIDLLMGGDGRLELLDFKTSPKPSDSPDLLETYERQLSTYAHILEKRHGKKPDRLYLYWTAEPKKTDALMRFPYRPELVDEAARDFDAVVSKIKSKDFRIVNVPEKKICRECDMRAYCVNEGTLDSKAIW
jgi:DNA helicase-2/ATP-dependent DNA helicase PcrA